MRGGIGLRPAEGTEAKILVGRIFLEPPNLVKGNNIVASTETWSRKATDEKKERSATRSSITGKGEFFQQRNKRIRAR